MGTNIAKELIRTSFYLRFRKKVTIFAANSYLHAMKIYTLCV